MAKGKTKGTLAQQKRQLLNNQKQSIQLPPHVQAASPQWQQFIRSVAESVPISTPAMLTDTVPD